MTVIMFMCTDAYFGFTVWYIFNIIMVVSYFKP